MFAVGASYSGDKIYFFYGQGCPHCEVVEEYFTDNNIYSKYQIDKKEIYGNKENARLLISVLSELGYPTDQIGVPTVVVGSEVLVGDKIIIESFESAAENLKNSQNNLNKEIENIKKTENTAALPNLTVIAVAGAAIVDAINPCAFAVLLILMTTVLARGSAKEALKSGLAFSLAIFVSYLLMGIGAYTALSYGNIGKLLVRVIGIVAIVLGLFNIKDFFWYGKVFLIEVPLSWRPRMKKLINSVTSPVGALFTGFIVSLFLLPCTSGPYIVILGLLANSSAKPQALAYLALYNIIFVSPMILITLAVYRGMDPAKLETLRQKNLRILHLFAGIILLVLGFFTITSF